jgi:hypothetical protein
VPEGTHSRNPPMSLKLAGALWLRARTKPGCCCSSGSAGSTQAVSCPPETQAVSSPVQHEYPCKRRSESCPNTTCSGPAKTSAAGQHTAPMLRVICASRVGSSCCKWHTEAIWPAVKATQRCSKQLMLEPYFKHSLQPAYNKAACKSQQKMAFNAEPYF